MKKLLLVLATCCLSSSAFAATAESNTKVKLDGFFQFQSGFINQNKLSGSEKNVSRYRRDFGFYTEATLAASVAQTVDDITYGGKLVLVPTTKSKTSASYNGSHIFVESNFGKVEVGSPYDAGSKMRVIGDQIVAATGSTGNWARYANLTKCKNMKYFGTNDSIKGGVAPEFVDYKEYFFDSLFRTQLDQLHDKAEPARKISYFTPKMQGFQFGISYIPDSGNTGGTVHNEDPLKSKSGIADVKAERTDTFVLNRNVKDAFSAGVTYEHNISDGVDLKLAATGEYGKAADKIRLMADKGKDNHGTEKEAYKPADLKTYNLGAVLTYGSFSYAASYGSLGKSLTAKEYHKTGRNTWYYNGAVAYSQGPIKTSISYFKSDRFKSTVDAVALGTEYKFLPGLVPYAEIACFQAKGRPAHYPEAPKKKTKGTVALIGAKLKL